MNESKVPEEIKWRGSTYQLEKVEEDRVHWFNPVSRHKASCQVDSWKKHIPYDDSTS
jgi:hypothetical protein